MPAISKPSRPKRGAAPVEDIEKLSRLTRQDWINAAWKMLGEGSIETVKVDRLATKIGVTRGSFYWHFKNREDLLDAIVDFWLCHLGVNEAILPLIEGNDPPFDKLWSIYRYIVINVNGPQSAQLRIWSQKSPDLTERIANEDKARIRLYRDLLREGGFDDETAQRRAELYFGMAMSDFLRTGTLSVEERLRQARQTHIFLTSA